MRRRLTASLLALTAGLAVTLAGCAGSTGGGAAAPAGTAATTPAAGGTVAPPATAPSTPPSTAALDPCPAAGHGHADLPALILPCLGAGPAVDLATLTGSPTLVTVWGQWCPPCVAEAPFLQQVYAALAPAGLRVLGVDTLDTDAKALAFAARAGLTYPSVVDEEGTLLRRYAPGPPVTLFVAADGRLAHVHRGQYPSAAALRADVATYLGVRG